MAKRTPLRRFYDEVKEQYPGVLVVMRTGSMYEAFDDDAETLVLVLDGETIAWTRSASDRVGFSTEALEAALRALVKAGHRVCVMAEGDEVNE